MDSQVKERIVGAAVLVAIGVWFFPWILDGSGTDEDASAPLESPVLAPAEDVLPVRTETVNLEPVEPEPAESEPVPASAELAEPPAASVAEPDTPAEPPEMVADVQPDLPEREQPAVEPVRSEPEPEEPAAANDEESGWLVQLGSFGEEANARQLAGRVADIGFDARVTEFETRGRLLHRVRIGGYSSRAQAEAAVSALSAHGFVAQVVAPEE